MAAIGTLWANVGDVPDTVSKWQSFTDSVQITRPCSIPILRTLMRNVLQLEYGISRWSPLPSAYSGSLLAILAQCVGGRINDVKTMVAFLGEMESRRQQKAYRTVSASSFVSRSNGAPERVTRTHMWSRLLRSVADCAKTDGKCNAYLLELWKQLQAAQYFLQPQKKKLTGKSGGVPHSCWKTTWLCQPPKTREEISFGHLNSRQAEKPMYRGWVGTRGRTSNWLFIGPLQMPAVLALVDTGAKCTLYMETLRSFRDLRSLLMVMGDTL